MLDHRLRILLDQPRYEKIVAEARRRHTSVGAVIRDAIDRLPVDVDRRRAAIGAILAAEPMEVPKDPRELRRDLDEAHDRFPS